MANVDEYSTHGSYGKRVDQQIPGDGFSFRGDDIRVCEVHVLITWWQTMVVIITIVSYKPVQGTYETTKLYPNS